MRGNFFWTEVPKEPQQVSVRLYTLTELCSYESTFELANPFLDICTD